MDDLPPPPQPVPGATAIVGAPPLPQVPGYEILGEVGRGGMGIVYRARQVSLNRIVALKMLLAGSQAEPELLTRFRAEAEAVARLQHPNIVQIHDVGEHEGRLYCCLEYVPGGSLARRVEGAPQPPREAAELVATLARAMHHAHEVGIVHRDLKPANILLVSGGAVSGAESDTTTHHSPLTTHQPKIADFGLAKYLDRDSGNTRSGAILGTPSYMAPEQVKGNRRLITPATDVYALGAILYELLTGRPPFCGDNAFDTLQQVLSAEPVPPSRFGVAVPPALEKICLRCLEKEPGRRYASAAELAADLQRFLTNEPGRSDGGAGQRGKHLGRLAGIAGGVGVAVVAVFLLARALWTSAVPLLPNTGHEAVSTHSVTQPSKPPLAASLPGRSCGLPRSRRSSTASPSRAAKWVSPRAVSPSTRPRTAAPPGQSSPPSHRGAFTSCTSPTRAAAGSAATAFAGPATAARPGRRSRFRRRCER
jgi:eukaryotic-like serine/threonine-protein kinase